jgi:D-proline reductase (dithiol) PrdB
MASLDDFTLPTRLFLKAYPWRRIDPVPWTAPGKPLAESKLALVTSAAFCTPDQEPFDESIKGGDVSYRVLPDDVDLKVLQEHHRSESFDHRGIHQDPNLAFPRDRAHELAAEGFVGLVNRRHLSFMGSIVAPGRLRTQTAPEAAGLFKQDQVDIVLLVPV